MTPTARHIAAPVVVAVLAALAAAPRLFAQAPRRAVLAVPPNGQPVTEAGRIRGYESVDYEVRVRAGDSLRVQLTTDQPSNYMNVLGPDADTALFVGARSGGAFAARLGSSGVYVVRVYLMRNAARRNVTANYRLTAAVARPAGTRPPAVRPGTVVQDAPFDRSVGLNGVSFRVRTSRDATGRRLTVTPTGLSQDNTPMTSIVGGPVTGVDVSDIDADGSPELWVYVRTADARGFPQQVVGYATNRRRSMSQIAIPDEPAAEAQRAGYRGRDEFRVVDRAFVRRFPIHDRAGAPTGRTRQIRYRLVPGEASWQLRAQRATEF